MFNESIIKTTGQWWKANVFFWGEIFGGIILFIGLANLEQKELGFALAVTGIAIGAASFIFGCTSIRCPKCNAPWLWQGVSGKSSNEWLNWLLSQSKCPKCSHEENT